MPETASWARILIRFFVSGFFLEKTGNRGWLADLIEAAGALDLRYPHLISCVTSSFFLLTSDFLTAPRDDCRSLRGTSEASDAAIFRVVVPAQCGTAQGASRQQGLFPWE